MDTQSGEVYIEHLASFVRIHEKSLANALQLRNSRANQGNDAKTLWQVLTSSLTSGSNPKAATISLTPHHLFFLLSRFEDLGVSVGPMNVRLDNTFSLDLSSNYVSFLSKGKTQSLRSVGSVNSLHGITTISTIVSSIFKGDPALAQERKSEKARADLKYLYSAFTKIPCLKISSDPREALIKGYEEFPFDCAVPLLAFKNLSSLEIKDVDFRQFFGWDRLSEQLRSLSVIHSAVDSVDDLLVMIVLDDLDKKRRRTRSSNVSSNTSPDYLNRSAAHDTDGLNLHPDLTSYSGQSPRLADIVTSTSSYSSYYTRHASSSKASRSTISGLPSSSTVSEGRSSFTSLSNHSNVPMTGYLPASKWRFLRHLCLADNALTSISPSGLAPLANTLSSLDLSGNFFKEVPDSLASLAALRSLNLSSCMISSLLSLTRNPLPAITSLNLRNNRLISIDGIGRLYFLERVDFRDNKITDPTELARLTDISEIREIWVQGNPFTKTHKHYRVTIFSLFRTTGYLHDILIDMDGPSYSERGKLHNQVAEESLVPRPVGKPLQPNPSDSVPSIAYIRDEHPTRRERKPKPKRRIVDLSTLSAASLEEVRSQDNDEIFEIIDLGKTRSLDDRLSVLGEEVFEGAGSWAYPVAGTPKRERNDENAFSDAKLQKEGTFEISRRDSEEPSGVHGAAQLQGLRSVQMPARSDIERGVSTLPKSTTGRPALVDGESSLSEESAFSTDSIEISSSSLQSAQDDAVEYLAEVFGRDTELFNLCEEARKRHGIDKVARKFMRLLRQYFVDLGSEAQNAQQKQAVRFLRGREQRARMTEKVCGLEDPPVENNREAMRALRKQKVDRLLNLNRLLEPGTLGAKGDKEKEALIASQPNQHTTSSFFPDADCEDPMPSDASIHSHGSAKEGDELHEELGNKSLLELDNFSVPQLASVVELFTEGASFRALKLSLRHFVYPSEKLANAIVNQSLDNIQELLIADFEAVAQDEYAWLHELNEFGYTREQIAELLLEEANDSPWIIFERQDIQRSSVNFDYHHPFCVHRGGQNLSSSPALLSAVPKERTGGLFTFTAISAQEKASQLVQEQCGLGGVAPISPNRDEWNGFVEFADSHCTALVCYSMPQGDETVYDATIQRIINALEGFCNAVSHVQKAGLMCQSFTIICGSSSSMATKYVELCNIDLDPIPSFQQELDNLLQQPGSSRTRKSLESRAHEILSPIGFPTPLPNLDPNLDHTIHICSLAVQFLCLGFLSYSRAHSGATQPFFLDCPLERIILLGTPDKSSNLHIDVQLQELTCMGDMTKDLVAVFRRSDEGVEQKCDLLASPEDIMDTWGPGQFLTAPADNGIPRIYAISIGGGMIVANAKSKDKDNWSWHWTPGTVSPPFVKSFDQHSKMLIGTAVTIKENCPVDVDQRWMMCSESLENLGTFQSAWDVSERQSGLQGGQFVNFQFNQTWTKTPGNTLKQIQLDLPDNHLLPFLQSSWGLQVSLCTSVARRVPLRELVADVMPAFVESLFPIPQQWETLKIAHGILDAFRTQDLQEWLGNLDPELQQLVARIVRYILLTLQYTGIDKKGGHLIIAWIQRNKPFQCFKVPCEKESYWARILADSGDCATFAYITPKCLETEWLKCKGPQATWNNASALLETAVCRHRPDNQANFAGAVAPWVLKHADLYSMGKPDTLFWVRVERPVGNQQPKLHVQWSMIPRGMRFRLDVRKMPKKLQRLRERQAIDAPAEMVVILAGKVSRA